MEFRLSTNEQKIEFYTKMLEYAIEHPTYLNPRAITPGVTNGDHIYGLCELALTVSVGCVRIGDVMRELPELYAYKPEDSVLYDYWFESREERLEVLADIIDRLKEKRNPFINLLRKLFL